MAYGFTSLDFINDLLNSHNTPFVTYLPQKQQRVPINLNLAKLLSLRYENPNYDNWYIPTTTSDVLKKEEQTEVAENTSAPFENSSGYKVDLNEKKNVEVTPSKKDNNISLTVTHTLNEAGSKKVMYKGLMRDLDLVILNLIKNDVVDWRRPGMGKYHHKCTRFVSNALTGLSRDTHSGVGNPINLYNQLKKDGWSEVPIHNYKPQKGDIFVTWTGNGESGPRHSSMFSGLNWISYLTENNHGNPWLWEKKDDKTYYSHIMRYNK